MTRGAPRPAAGGYFVRRGAPTGTARWLLRAVVAGAVVLGAVAPAGPARGSATAPAPAPTESGALDVPDQARFELAAVTPAVVTPGADLTVSGSLRAGSDGAVPAGSLVQLRLQRSVLSTREGVAGWVDPAQTAVGSLLSSQPLAQALAPGAALPVSFTVPAEDLGLSDRPDAWGPRGISVTVRDSTETEYLVTTRTHLTWFPVAEATSRTDLSVLVPLTGSSPDPVTGTNDLDALAALTAPGSRLDAVLQGAAVPGVTVVLDPAVLDATDVSPPAPDPLASDAQTGGTAADGAGGADAGPGPAADVELWRDRVRAVADTHDVLLLPYADPDLAALAHADQAQVAELAEEQARSVTQQVLGEGVRTDVAWVPGGDVDPETLDLLAGLGRRAVVLDDTAQPPLDPPRDTPSGRSTVRGGQAPTDGLVDDGPLSSALSAVDDAATGTGAPGADVVATQRLLAESAAVTLEHPGVGRHLLATAPRDWSPSAEQAVAALTALTTAPWLRVAPLQDLLDSAPGDVARAPVELTEQERAEELPPAGVAGVGSTLTTTEAVAAAMDDPRPTVRRAQRSAVALVATHWRTDRAGWQDAVSGYAARLTALRNAVRVVPGSTVTQVSRNVELPVTLENDLDQPVTVVVDVRPESSRLVVTRRDTVTLPANDRTVLYVPVRGVGNGDTSVRVELLTTGGTSLGDPVRTRVLVRADWETQGTFLLAGFAALVLVAGLVRTFRRGPRRRSHNPLAVP